MEPNTDQFTKKYIFLAILFFAVEKFTFIGGELTLKKKKNIIVGWAGEMWEALTIFLFDVFFIHFETKIIQKNRHRLQKENFFFYQLSWPDSKPERIMSNIIYIPFVQSILVIGKFVC